MGCSDNDESGQHVDRQNKKPSTLTLLAKLFGADSGKEELNIIGALIIKIGFGVY